MRWEVCGRTEAQGPAAEKENGAGHNQETGRRCLEEGESLLPLNEERKTQPCLKEKADDREEKEKERVKRAKAVKTNRSKF